MTMSKDRKPVEQTQSHVKNYLTLRSKVNIICNYECSRHILSWWWTQACVKAKKITDRTWICTERRTDGWTQMTDDRQSDSYIPHWTAFTRYNLVLYLKRSNLFSKGLSLVCIGKGNITTCLHYSEMSHRKQIKQMLYILIEYGLHIQRILSVF